MFSNEIFTKKMARSIADEQLSEVAGGWFVPNTCHVSGMDDGYWEPDNQN